MALRKCSECGHEVSTGAKACPNCGAPPPHNFAMLAGNAIVLLFLAFVVISVISSDGTSSSNDLAPTNAAAADADQLITAEFKTAGCANRDTLLRMMSAAADNDTEAIGRLITSAVQDRDCIYFTPGEKVLVMGTANDHGVEFIRLLRENGDPREWWAPESVLAKR